MILGDCVTGVTVDHGTGVTVDLVVGFVYRLCSWTTVDYIIGFSVILLKSLFIMLL